MNVKTKTSLVIVFTLIVGMVIGSLLSRTLLHKKMERVFSRRQPEVFTKLYMEFMKPKVTQKDQVQEILKTYGIRLNEIRRKSRMDQESTMLAMMSDLESFLTPEQLEWLELKSSRGGRPTWWDSAKKLFVYLESELILTENQVVQLKKILEESQKKSQDRMQKRIPGGKTKTFLGQMENIEEDVKKILTETQKEKFDKLHEIIRKKSQQRDQRSSEAKQ
ncbi:hypothetical protein ACFLRX_05105 [Acidobacteriota bacterium]